MINTLNKEQKEAVTCNDSRIVCVAGAGSGKTHCLIERIQRLVDEGADPTSMLVLTFTKAAAFEMKERYISKYGGGVTSVPEFRTFHSFCYNLLSRDNEVLAELGYTSVPAIAEPESRKRMEREAKLRSGVKLSEKKLASGEALTPKEEYDIKLYRRHLKKQMQKDNKITFDTLCESVCKLFETNHPCIQIYKDKYKYIFVDEFQDTDEHQWDFVKSFKDADLYVCGDALQNLYSFRGTTNKILKDLTVDPNWTTIKITQNYRSSRSIVDFANDLSTYADDSYRIQMSTDSDKNGIVEVHKLLYRSKYSGTIQDIEYSGTDAILADIKKLGGSTALLCRTNKEVDAIKAYLDSQKVKYTENSSSSEVPYLIKSLHDNEYLISWVSSFLNSADYARYVRLETVGYPDKEASHITNFYTTFRRFPALKYRMDTVVQMKDVLRSKELTLAQRCASVFQLLGIDEIVDESRLHNLQDIEDYILEIHERKQSSDIYVGTIHSVKGLEYDNVVLYGVNDSSFQLKNEDNLNLYYVGVTRAREVLHVFKWAGY